MATKTKKVYVVLHGEPGDGGDWTSYNSEAEAKKAMLEEIRTEWDIPEDAKFRLVIGELHEVTCEQEIRLNIS